MPPALFLMLGSYLVFFICMFSVALMLTLGFQSRVTSILVLAVCLCTISDSFTLMYFVCLRIKYICAARHGDTWEVEIRGIRGYPVSKKQSIYRLEIWGDFISGN